MSVQALRQRLKEIGEKTFEDLCFQILAAKYPESQIRKVEGAGGDKGLDIFHGQLSVGPTVWQCKFFPNGIRDAQKKQVKKSLKAAIQNFTPKRWVLCVPVDLSTNAHRWFQELQEDNSEKLQMDLLQASSIIGELIARREICEAFFPNANEINSIKAMKALLLGTDELDDAQLSTITDETAQQYLQRLKDNDPRVDYEISYPVGIHPTAFQVPQSPKPGLMVSVFDGKKRIDVIAKDREALRLDPPKIRLGFSPAARSKLERILRKGTTEQFGVGEFKIASNSFDYLLPDGASEQATSLTVGQKQTDAVFPFSVTARCGKERVRFNSIRFARIRGGLEEVELKSVATDIGWAFRIVLRTDGSGDTELVRDLRGQEVTSAAKALQFEKMLRSGGTIEIIDLTRGAALVDGTVSFPDAEIDGALERAVVSLAKITDRLGVSFLVPTQLSPEDWQNLDFVEQVIEKGFGPASVNDLAAEIARVSEDVKSILETFRQGVILSLPADPDPVITLVGRQVSLGPATAIIQKPKVKNFDAFAKMYVAASPGAVVHVEFEPTLDAQIWFPRYMRDDAPVPIASTKE